MRLGFILLLSGCASLPACPRPEAMILDTPRGPYVLMSAQQLVTFQERMEGIRDGKCDPNKDPDAI